MVFTLLMTPLLEEKNYLYKIKTSARQSIVAFYKFGTIGIGFDKEKDWNCNLPYTCSAEEIYKHIEHNKHPSAKKEDVVKAIERIQEAIKSRVNKLE